MNNKKRKAIGTNLDTLKMFTKGEIILREMFLIYL